MDKYKISLLLQCLVFLIPINIYVIGDWLGTGVQWALLPVPADIHGRQPDPGNKRYHPGS